MKNKEELRIQKQPPQQTHVQISVAKLVHDDPRRIAIVDFIGEFHLVQWNEEGSLTLMESFQIHGFQHPCNELYLLPGTARELVFNVDSSPCLYRCSLPLEEDSFESVRSYSSNDGEICSFAMNKSGGLLFSVSRDGHCCLWDVFSMTLIDSKLELQMGLLTQIEFLGPNKVVIGLSTGDCWIWNLTNFRIVFERVLSFTSKSVNCLKTQLCSNSYLMVVDSSPVECIVLRGTVHGDQDWVKSRIHCPEEEGISPHKIFEISISLCGSLLAVVYQSSSLAFVLVVYALPSGEVKMKSALSSMPCLLEFLVINMDPITMETKLQLLVVYQVGIPQCSLLSLEIKGECSSHGDASEQCSIIEGEVCEDTLPRSFPLSGPEIIASSPIIKQPSCCGVTGLDADGSLSLMEDEEIVNSPGTSQKSTPKLDLEIPEEPQKEMNVIPYKSQLKEDTKNKCLPNKPFENLDCFSSVQKCSSKLTEMKLKDLEHRRFNWDSLQKTTSIKNRIQVLKKRIAVSKIQKSHYVNLPPAEINSSHTKTKILPKQLDENWLRNSALRPQIQDFWNPKEFLIQDCDTEAVDDPDDFLNKQLIADSTCLIPPVFKTPY